MALVAVGTADAGFVPVEDFEGLAPGPISGQNGWFAASASSAVTVDPAGGTNQVLSVVTESTRLHKGMPLLDGTARMVFLRFRYAEQLNLSLGMSASTSPDQFGDFDPELSMNNASSELRINDDGSYDLLTVLEPDTWYSCWCLIDNETDDTQVWLHARPGDPAGAGDQLDSDGQTVFAFRSGSAPDLVTFFIKTGGGNGLVGPLYVDDLYLEDTDALNLTNPSGVVVDVPAMVQSPRPPALSLATYPSPFRSAATIDLTLPGSGRLDVEVFDAGGRRAAPGVYIVRARAGNAVVSGRVVLVE